MHPEDATERPRPIAYACRTDGLGERLRAIVNAIALAKTLNIEFRFEWCDNKADNGFHAVPGVDRVFSRAFINRYYRPRDTLTERCIVDFDHWGENNADVYRVNQTIPRKLRTNPAIAKAARAGMQKRAFSRIGFSDEIATVIAQAEAVALGDDTLAIHLRAGDIVYGEFKHSPHFTLKVIPYLIAERMIIEARDQGQQVLLFSQDPALAAFFAARYDVLVAQTFASSTFNAVQHAMFDIILMSRCRRIVAGESGFAIVASAISGSEFVSHLEWMPRDAMAQALADGLRLPSNERNDLPALHVASGCAAAIQLGHATLADTALLDLAQLGMKHDPHNEFLPLYAFFIAHRHLLETQDDEALRVVNDNIESELLARPGFLPTLKRYWFASASQRSNFDRYGFTAFFLTLIQRGSPQAAVLLHGYYRGADNQAEFKALVATLDPKVRPHVWASIQAHKDAGRGLSAAIAPPDSSSSTPPNGP